jgi:hypothetical protein
MVKDKVIKFMLKDAAPEGIRKTFHKLLAIDHLKVAVLSNADASGRNIINRTLGDMARNSREERLVHKKTEHILLKIVSHADLSALHERGRSIHGHPSPVKRGKKAG